MHFSGRGRESSSTRDSGAECAPSFTIRKYATNKKYFSMVCSFINFRKDLPNIPTTKISTAGGGAPGCVAQSLGLQTNKKEQGIIFSGKTKDWNFPNPIYSNLDSLLSILLFPLNYVVVNIHLHFVIFYTVIFSIMNIT